MMKHFLLVDLGSAIGSVLRYGGGLLYLNKLFPITSFFTNITCNVAQAKATVVWKRNDPVSHNCNVLPATVVCVGFKTFSTFSFKNLQLQRDRKIAMSLLYLPASL